MDLPVNTIICGECIAEMAKYPANTFDGIFTDPPYGVTQNEADQKVSNQKLFGALWKLAKDNAAVIMTSQQPFTTELINAQKDTFRYDLVWHKTGKATGFLNANRMPLRIHEHILVFYQKLPVYNPQKTKGDPNHPKGSHSRGKKQTNRNYGDFDQSFESPPTTDKFPTSIIEFPSVHPPIHPTQKPVELMAWLIKTYSNPNQLILDPFCGSGTTCVAAKMLGRRYIGIEISEKYCEIARMRLKAVDTGVSVNEQRQGQRSLF